ncbi:MAG: glutamate synthase large subunit, partial [Candidatus Omnitrophica bacterium]|nr:glutamate synthase large subunit [Candidatus Omnitrophota bacterium]
PKKQGLYDPQFEHDSCGVGFLCDIKGKKSNLLVKQSLEVLRRLAHRGATGADPQTGDGAGILIQIPHEFFAHVCQQQKIDLSKPGSYGTGLIFLPKDTKERQFCKNVFSTIIEEENCALLGWRQVPVDNSRIGKTARQTEPQIEQIFITSKENLADPLTFERKLYIIRKRIENAVRASALTQQSFFYITNLSCRTFSYKGLLMPGQLEQFFLDFNDPLLTSAISLVHSRYSTNTFPTWDLAQPFRYLAHNGEINTLRGNINRMQARESLFKSPLFKSDIKKIKPVVVHGGSDSATIDNVFELLLLAGRDLPEAMMMLIPGAWEQNSLLDEKIKNFYKYHACFMEPWDGPAAIAFTDGVRVGAVLDRNGLRPARYIITKNNFVVMASEMGVLDIDPADILVSGRLTPGKMFFIDTQEGRIINDEEIKENVASRKPYGAWIAENMVSLRDLEKPKAQKREAQDTLTLLKAFGYTREDLKMIIAPMAQEGKEPVGSMGNDIPHAVLSQNPQLLFTYFKQLFAQVTNPAIDPIREEVVMSLTSYIGGERNLLEETPEHCHTLEIKNPILTNFDCARINEIHVNNLKTKIISTLFPFKHGSSTGEEDFKRALTRICSVAVDAIREGYTFITLSDRGANKAQAALPSLLALGAVHHHLLSRALRSRVGIVVESAEPREVHHFALLFGYGADCVNPYLAYDAVTMLTASNDITLNPAKALQNYIHATQTGILKVLSKMGISTLQSYRGAQIFEALGVAQEVIDMCFTGTVSRIGGVGFKEIARETLLRHETAYPQREIGAPYLASGGIYQWRRDGEFHLWNPETIASLQDATRSNDYAKYREFSRRINDQSKNPTTLRSLLDIAFEDNGIRPVSIDTVEPAENIFKRFATGAMSFGSISKTAHETLAIAMNRLGGRSNTGEGGEDPVRFSPLPSGDSLRSAIKQVASGRFGVTANYLVNADELQIKIAQGAKPGEGGQLPGHKVSTIIARTRYTTPGVTLISPPPHHDIYSIEDLAQLIFDLKNINPKARISVKLVSEIGVGTIAAGVAKGHADMILISGGDGGTGASPLSSIKHAGLPWELGLSEAHQTLVLNDLRSRVRLQTDGQMRTGRDVAIAAMLGAEEFGFSTAALIVCGCVMLRHCHLNNCSVGVATQDEILEKHFKGKPEYIINYFHFVVQELREIMARLGIRTLDELIGRTELLCLSSKIVPWKTKNIDFSRILHKPKVPANIGVYFQTPQDHGIDKVLDLTLIKKAKEAIDAHKNVSAQLPIHNTDRTTGAMLSGEVVRRHGETGLDDDTIRFKFKGVAGQSFGAFLAKGITFELEGMANDYVGKGISGGKIIIRPDTQVDYTSQQNVIIGNTAFYGAISGEAYIRGLAGERFCIRNSGLNAVVEGLGDHGCEYMTGGRVVVLGRTGINFGAGMSGGIAYIYDSQGDFKNKCNLEMVALESVLKDEEDTIHNLLYNHYTYTSSFCAKSIIDNFKKEIRKFVKVMPREYKRILSARTVGKKLDLAEVSDG